ncbi:ferredoxin family protein [Burkholderia pseudomallei]|uniref:ferredoxin family protein n=1 Tax=Burkholderia pseudomallei TaxID=28450 RepID=UPI00053831FE|nr:ferredoxin family protein [Burkholderia pseudomallei]KAA8771231.1 ferredoxin family protein [Burkholderia pseudomallei]KGW59684.1 ferredoxin 1 [Burkholderia pseudomallei MSHR1357]KKC14904.1 ferredoxin 1 [Burkholderia pseudomallei MSHR1328]OMZ94253.1 hypothetical protein AQ874_12465 [Burkholderia pseudomallei]ONB88973.1 hypothetical protein AQ908_28300 [Burkholderia pseudomallei]
MTFVVMEGCIRCKHTDCVAVCPVDCFHEGPNFLVIDPDECIDCALWLRIIGKKPALPDHAAWADVQGKLAQLDRNGA